MAGVKASAVSELIGTLDDSAAVAASIVVEEYVNQLVEDFVSESTSTQALCALTHPAISAFTQSLLAGFNWRHFRRRYVDEEQTSASITQALEILVRQVLADLTAVQSSLAPMLLDNQLADVTAWIREEIVCHPGWKFVSEPMDDDPHVVEIDGDGVSSALSRSLAGDSAITTRVAVRSASTSGAPAYSLALKGRTVNETHEVSLQTDGIASKSDVAEKFKAVHDVLDKFHAKQSAQQEEVAKYSHSDLYKALRQQVYQRIRDEASRGVSLKMAPPRRRVSWRKAKAKSPEQTSKQSPQTKRQQAKQSSRTKNHPIRAQRSQPSRTTKKATPRKKPERSKTQHQNPLDDIPEHLYNELYSSLHDQVGQRECDEVNHDMLSQENPLEVAARLDQSRAELQQSNENRRQQEKRSKQPQMRARPKRSASRTAAHDANSSDEPNRAYRSRNLRPRPPPKAATMSLQFLSSSTDTASDEESAWDSASSVDAGHSGRVNKAASVVDEDQAVVLPASAGSAPSRPLDAPCVTEQSPTSQSSGGEKRMADQAQVIQTAKHSSKHGGKKRQQTDENTEVSPAKRQAAHQAQTKRARTSSDKSVQMISVPPEFVGNPIVEKMCRDLEEQLKQTKPRRQVMD